MAITLPTETLALLIIMLIVVILALLHHARALEGKRPIHRRVFPAFDLIQRALAVGAETGRAVHLSPGAGVIGSRTSTIETIAGLMAAEKVASEAALSGAPILVSSGDAVAHLSLRGTLRQAYRRAGLGQDYVPGNVQLLAQQDGMAYASGVATLYNRQRLGASQMIGSFGQEFTLIGENGAQREVPQLAGTTNTTGLPLIYLTADATLVGEEIYAADSYLSRAAAPQARLLTMDTLRTVVIVVITALALLSWFGVQLAL